MGISNAVAEQLDLEIVEPPAVNPRLAAFLPPQLNHVEDVPINVLGLELQMQQMYVFDMDVPIVNLSLLMFSDFLVQVDYLQSQICFLDRTAIPLEDVANIDMRNALSGAPAIEVTLNGERSVWLALQLGYPGAVLVDYETAEYLEFIEIVNQQVVSEDSAVATQTGVVELLKFGPYELGNIAVEYATRKPPSRRSRRSGVLTGSAAQGRVRAQGVETHGQLGHEILQHFVLTIDFEEERMHVFVP